tara:strand:+ start:887 stop:1075 length:189 start_codon:yes stop_codon:yes gene_type:complete
MRNFIIASLILFLLYTNSSFRSYTLKGLQSITNFIKELPKELPEETIKDEEEETLKSGSSTY